MKRVLLALLLWPALASAQSPVAPWPGVSVPIFGISSNVAGDGTFTPQLFGPQSCTVPAYSYTGATTNGWGASGGTTLCPVISGASVATFTTSAFTLGTGLTNGWVDAFLSYESAAVIQQGADAAGVTNQMFKGPDRITSDGVGGNLTIAGGRNRGASAGGSLIFQTSPAAGAGVTGTLATQATITPTGLNLQTGIPLNFVAAGGGFAVGDVLTWNINAATAYQFHPNVDAAYDIGFSSKRVRDFYLSQNLKLGSALAISATAPTAAGTGMAFSVGTGSTAFAWTITISTANAQSAFTLTLPTATNAWNCWAQSLTNPGSMKIAVSSRTTTTNVLTQYAQTLGTAAAYVDANVIFGSCVAQ